MRWRFTAVLLASGLVLLGQAALSVDQLVSFVRSSIQLKHPDRQVADYLRKVKLASRLGDEVILELEAAGAGPRPGEALRALQEASRALPEAVKEVPKAAPLQIPPPPEAEWRRVIEQTREYALNYSRQLPDFICTQVTRRYIDPSGLEFWQTGDVLTARLSYFEQKEDYKLMLVNGRYTEADYRAVGGAISSGEFGSLLREIFEKSSAATFGWERWATLRGRRMYVFHYRVEQPRSKWTIEWEKQMRITTAYRGLVFVDAETGVVARVTLEAEDIPPSFPIQQVSSTLDYDLAEIGEQKFMLPLRAVMRMREGRSLFKNEVEFRLYRKFSAEATISFETPEPLPEDQVTEQPAKP
jgi:hypothetical protein